MSKEQPFKVIVAGGRDFDNYTTLRKCLCKLLCNKNNVVIVSGGARGTDSLGEKFAKELGYVIKVFPADWDEHGKKAGILRNIEMAEYADALVAFWDGYSRGTKHMIDTAKKKGLECRVMLYGQ